jgi:hypothetical protein
MTPAEFTQSLSAATGADSGADAGTKTPPHDLAPALAALWWAKRGDWDKAHKLVMGEDGRDAAWVHAHLHRVEGDAGNAAYWYRQAGQPVARGALDAEWDAIVAALIARGM